MLKAAITNNSQKSDNMQNNISFIQCRNNITQDLNSNTWTDVNITGIEDFNVGEGFVIEGNGGIRCLFDGYIEIYASVRGQSDVQRAANEIRVTKNDIAFEPISSSGYIRSASPHRISSSSIRIMSDCKTNDIIKIQSHKSSMEGVVDMIIGTSVFIVKKIK